MKQRHSANLGPWRSPGQKAGPRLRSEVPTMLSVLHNASILFFGSAELPFAAVGSGTNLRSSTESRSHLGGADDL